MMVLSELVNTFNFDNSGIDLYHGKYQYKVVVKFQCINRARYYNSVEKFSDRLNYRIFKTDLNIKSIILRDGGSIEDLFTFIEWRNANKSNNFKSMICGNYITFYFNDSVHVQSFFDTFDLQWIGYYRHRIANHQKGVVYLKKSQYQWRIYLNNHRLDDSENNTLVNLINNYGIKPCPMLANTVNKTGLWSKGSLRGSCIYCTNFFDISDESTLTVVGLHIPHLIRKICSIVRY